MMDENIVEYRSNNEKRKIGLRKYNMELGDRLAAFYQKQFSEEERLIYMVDLQKFIMSEYRKFDQIYLDMTVKLKVGSMLLAKFQKDALEKSLQKKLDENLRKDMGDVIDSLVSINSIKETKAKEVLAENLYNKISTRLLIKNEEIVLCEQVLNANNNVISSKNSLTSESVNSKIDEPKKIEPLPIENILGDSLVIEANDLKKVRLDNFEPLSSTNVFNLENSDKAR